jgi:IclR family transcriptional regulator, acetate operon repressor
MSRAGTPRTQSLSRAVIVLRAIAARPASSASELARASGLPRSTVGRTLRTLADAGMVEEQGGGWVIGRELVRIAQAADPDRRLLDPARPALERLRDVTGESALLAVPQGRPGLRIVLQVDPSRHVGVANWVGIDVPLHASAAGKLVLAELEESELNAWLARTKLVAFTSATITSETELRAELGRTRRRGFAELADELEDGHASLAVPLRDVDGALLALIGISGPTFRLGRARRRELLPLVQKVALELEAAITQSPRRATA